MNLILNFFMTELISQMNLISNFLMIKLSFYTVLKHHHDSAAVSDDVLLS